MENALLGSLRTQVLDESESLSGLLRKCLMLGAETGSESLRQWARYELNGYDDEVDLPRYRKLPTPIISVNSISGRTWAKGVDVNVLQLPEKVRDIVGPELLLRQPIEELQELSASTTLSLSSGSLAYAQHLWNQELGPFEQIVSMAFRCSGATISGVLGQIRTQLVDLVADLTAGTPLSELPRKVQVDAAMEHHIGTQYVTTVHAPRGPVAVGSKAVATSEGLSLDDAIRLLKVARAESAAVQDEGARTELLEAVDGLRVEAEGDAPDTGAVVRKVGRLQRAASAVGLPLAGSAVGGAIEAFTALALGGTFS